MENYGNFDIEIFLALYSVDRVPITNKKICCSGITSPHAIRDTRFRRLSSFFLPDVVKDVKKMNEHLQKNDSGDRFKISRMGLDPFPSLSSPPTLFSLIIKGPRKNGQAKHEIHDHVFY